MAFYSKAGLFTPRQTPVFGLSWTKSALEFPRAETETQHTPTVLCNRGGHSDPESLNLWDGGSDGKESAHDAGDPGLIPVLGRSPEGNGNPLQYSCPENSMGRGAWQATAHGVTKSQTQLSDSHTHTHTHRDSQNKEKALLVVLVPIILLRPDEEERRGSLTKRGGLKGKESPHSWWIWGLLKVKKGMWMHSIRMHGETDLFFAQDHNFTALSDISKQKTGHWTDTLPQVHKF